MALTSSTAILSPVSQWSAGVVVITSRSQKVELNWVLPTEKVPGSIPGSIIFCSRVFIPFLSSIHAMFCLVLILFGPLPLILPALQSSSVSTSLNHPNRPHVTCNSDARAPPPPEQQHSDCMHTLSPHHPYIQLLPPNFLSSSSKTFSISPSSHLPNASAVPTTPAELTTPWPTPPRPLHPPHRTMQHNEKPRQSK